MFFYSCFKIKKWWNIFRGWRSFLPATWVFTRIPRTTSGKNRGFSASDCSSKASRRTKADAWMISLWLQLPLWRHHSLVEFHPNWSNVTVAWPPILLDQHPEAPDAATDRNATPKRKHDKTQPIYDPNALANQPTQALDPLKMEWSDMEEPRIKTHKISQGLKMFRYVLTCLDFPI